MEEGADQWEIMFIIIPLEGNIIFGFKSLYVSLVSRTVTHCSSQVENGEQTAMVQSKQLEWEWTPQFRKHSHWGVSFTHSPLILELKELPSRRLRESCILDRVE